LFTTTEASAPVIEGQLGDAARGRVRQGRSPQIGVNDHPGGIDDRAQRKAELTAQTRLGSVFDGARRLGGGPRQRPSAVVLEPLPQQRRFLAQCVHDGVAPVQALERARAVALSQLFDGGNDVQICHEDRPSACDRRGGQDTISRDPRDDSFFAE
jgi:hypothetical protein